MSWNEENELFRLISKQVANRDVEIFRLKTEDYDLNAQDQYGNTALHLAVRTEDEESLIALLRCGASPNIRNEDGMLPEDYVGSFGPRMDFIQTLLSNHVTSYEEAIINEDVEPVRVLINSWCTLDQKIDGLTLEEFAASRGGFYLESLIRSMRPSMELAHAVLAQDVDRVRHLLQTSKPNFQFKNMADRCASVKYYALKSNNVELVNAVLDVDEYRTGDVIKDESGNDLPLFFVALQLHLSVGILLRLLAAFKNKEDRLIDLHYKEFNILLYAITLNAPTEFVEGLLEMAPPEILTQNNPMHQNSYQLAIVFNKKMYLDVYHKILRKRVKENPNFLWNLVYFGFSVESLVHVLDLNTETDVHCSISELTNYQNSIEQLHQAVENNATGEEMENLIRVGGGGESMKKTNLLFSRTKSDYQTILHKLVLRQNFNGLDYAIEQIERWIVLDRCFDECFRTPLHYAFGIKDGRRMRSLLSQFGASDSAVDKDGQTPLDFLERQNCAEVQQLLKRQREKCFSIPEPDPWSDEVWKRIQKQRIRELRSQPTTNIHNHALFSHFHNPMTSYYPPNYYYDDEEEERPNQSANGRPNQNAVLCVLL